MSKILFQRILQYHITRASFAIFVTSELLIPFKFVTYHILLLLRGEKVSHWSDIFSLGIPLGKEPSAKRLPSLHCLSWTLLIAIIHRKTFRSNKRDPRKQRNFFTAKQSDNIRYVELFTCDITHFACSSIGIQSGKD